MLWLGQTVFAARFPSDKPRDRLLALAVVVAVGIMSTELVADGPRSLRFPIGFVAARTALLALYASVRCFSSEARGIADAYLVGFRAAPTRAAAARSQMRACERRNVQEPAAVRLDREPRPWTHRERMERLDECRRGAVLRARRHGLVDLRRARQPAGHALGVRVGPAAVPILAPRDRARGRNAERGGPARGGSRWVGGGVSPR